MATVKLELKNLPAKATETQLRKVLSPLGQVLGVSISGSTGLVEMEGTTAREAIDSSGLGEIRLADLRQIDSSGLGELSNVTVRLA